MIKHYCDVKTCGKEIDVSKEIVCALVLKGKGPNGGVRIEVCEECAKNMKQKFEKDYLGKEDVPEV